MNNDLIKKYFHSILTEENNGKFFIKNELFEKFSSMLFTKLHGLEEPRKYCFFIFNNRDTSHQTCNDKRYIQTTFPFLMSDYELTIDRFNEILNESNNMALRELWKKNIAK